jgi:hypothetical protein
VAGQEQKQDVVRRIHARADPLQRAGEVRDGRQRQLVELAGVVDERQRAALSAEAAFEQPRAVQAFLQEHVLVAIGPERDEVEIRLAGAAARDGGERLVQQCRLLAEHFLGDQRRRVRLLGFVQGDVVAVP